jgi:hypothetical protein
MKKKVLTSEGENKGEEIWYFEERDLL